MGFLSAAIVLRHRKNSAAANFAHAAINGMGLEMSVLLQKVIRVGILALLLVLIGLGGYSALLKQRVTTLRQQAALQQKTLAQQKEQIAALQAQDAQNRALMAAQQQQEQWLRQQGDNTERKYREAIKNTACAGQPMPGIVPELLRRAGADNGAVAP